MPMLAGYRTGARTQWGVIADSWVEAGQGKSHPGGAV